MASKLNPKTVIVLDDHQVVLEGMTIILQNSPEVQLLAAFEKIEAFQSYFKTTEKFPDVVIVDAHLGNGVSGIDLKEMNTHANCRWILFSSYVDRYLINKAREAGFAACISKEVQPSVLIEVIQNEDAKFYAFPEELHSENEVDAAPQYKEVFKSLTKREKQVIGVILSGVNSAEGANQLFISRLTYETHKRNIFRKLDIKSVPELIRIAVDYKHLL